MSVSADSRVTFSCLPKRRVTEEKGTPCRGATDSPALLAKPGGNQTRPNRLPKAQAVAELEQVIAESPRLGCAARRGRRGYIEKSPSLVMAGCPIGVDMMSQNTHLKGC